MLTVRPACASDLVYVDSLQRKNAEELSFYPRIVFEREIEKSRVLLAEINGDPVGYIYHGAFGVVCRIHQACIQYDARGYLYGAALVRHLTTLCEAARVSTISLRCGSDIAANGFWKTMGFSCVAVTPGGGRRMRDINNWQRNLDAQLFVVAIEPSNRTQDSSLWRKRAPGQKKSQFVRGKRLIQYRASLMLRGDE